MQELSSVGTFPILHDAARPVRRPTMLGDVAKLPNQVMVGEAGTGMKNGDSLV
jgi:hypothetical protein